jgi:hypothetical protein
VRRLPAPFGDEGDDLLPRDAHGVGRRQLVGDEDARVAGERREPVDCGPSFAQAPLQDRRDVVEVGGPQGEVLVGEVPQPVAESVRHDLDCPFGVHLLRPDLLLDGSEERRVAKEESVSLEDRRVLLAEARLDQAGHLADLPDSRLDGEAEPLELRRDFVGV